MNVAFQRNIGSYLDAVAAFAAQTITAGSGADGAAQNGLTFDRLTREPICLSALAVFHCDVDVGASESVSLNITVQDSANGTDWDSYDPGPPDDQYAATTVEEDGAVIVKRKLQLGGARRYVRVRLTATFSAGSTDTVDANGILVIGGADELPIETVTAPSA